VASHSHQPIVDHKVLGQTLNALAWGLLFVWLGIAILVDLGWAITLLGVGVIIVAEQMAKKKYLAGLSCPGFDQRQANQGRGANAKEATVLPRATSCPLTMSQVC
jgi:hypothetical protein